MFKKKSLFCFLAVMMVFCVIASGGCGGGSGGGMQEGISNENNENDTSPDTPTTPNNPTTPETPTTPDNPTTPDTPITPDNPSVIYNFGTMSGTWQASNGTGTAKRGTETAALSLSTRQGNKNVITFKNVVVSGTTAVLEASLDIRMDIAGYSDVIWEDEFGGYKPYETGMLEFENTSGNTWYMERLDSKNNLRWTRITLTSSTTAQVERYDATTDGYTFQFSYTLTKQ